METRNHWHFFYREGVDISPSQPSAHEPTQALNCISADARHLLVSDSETGIGRTESDGGGSADLERSAGLGVATRSGSNNLLPESSKVAQSQLTSVRQHVLSDNFDQGIHHCLQILLFEAGGCLQLSEQVTLANHLAKHQGKLRSYRCMKIKWCLTSGFGLSTAAILKDIMPFLALKGAETKENACCATSSTQMSRKTLCILIYQMISKDRRDLFLFAPKPPRDATVLSNQLPFFPGIIRIW
jgi:hypothetical protein